MLILSLEHILKAKNTRFHNSMLLNLETKAKSLRPRPKGPEDKAEARGYEAETEAKILALRLCWNAASWI